jgi:hypothetical protein
MEMRTVSNHGMDVEMSAKASNGDDERECHVSKSSDDMEKVMTVYSLKRGF